MKEEKMDEELLMHDCRNALTNNCHSDVRNVLKGKPRPENAKFPSGIAQDYYDELCRKCEHFEKW